MRHDEPRVTDCHPSPVNPSWRRPLGESFSSSADRDYHRDGITMQDCRRPRRASDAETQERAMYLHPLTYHRDS